MTVQPIIPNLVSSQRALTNKYTTGTLGQAVNAGLPLPRVTPLLMYDLARANRGLAPLTTRQSALALQTLASGQPATPPRRQGLFRSALGDLRSLVSEIPKLPITLFHEAQQLPDLPQNLAAATARADNPLQALGNIAAVPGLRMVPGAFVANQLLGDAESGAQGVQGLLAHPIFTGLDVLPAASGVAKLTPAARTASAAYAGQVDSLVKARTAEGFHPSTTVIPRRPRPLQTALTRRVDPTGQSPSGVVPNTLGQSLQAADQAFSATRLGNDINRIFRERGSSRVMNRGDTFLREWENLDIPNEALRPNIPGGLEAIPRELEIRGSTVAIRQALRDEGILPNTPEMEAFHRRATLSELPDGTPLPPEQMIDLPPAQRAIVRMIRDNQTLLSRYTNSLPGQQSTRTLTIDGTPETFDYRSGLRISKAQRLTAEAEAVIAARAIVDEMKGTNATPEAVAARFDEIAPVSDSSTAFAREMTRLRAAAMDISMIENPRQLIAVIRPLTTHYPRIPRVIDHLQKGRWSEAAGEIRAIEQTRYGQVLPVDWEGLRGALTQFGRADRTLARTASPYTDRYLTRVRRQQARIEATNTPARFDDLVRREARTRTTDRVRETFSTAPDLDRLIQLADEGIYDTIIKRDESFQRLVRKDQADARATWKALRDEGHDPIYFQRVTAQEAARQPFIRLSDSPRTLAAVQARMMDATPYVADVGVSLNQASLDMIQRRATEAAFTDIAASFGRTRADIVAEMEPRLRLGDEAPTGTRGGVPARARLDAIVRERYVPLSEVTSRHGVGGRGTFSVERADDIYIPRAMADNLNKMYEVSTGRLSTILDPITRTFRTSVLPLALRWQLNNLVGGVMVTAVNDPRAFLEAPRVVRKLWGERRTLPTARDRLMPEGAPPAGFGMGMSPDMRRWDVDAGSPVRDRLAAAAQYGAGSTLGRLYTSARDSRLKALPEGFRKAVETSYNANQFVDDVVRAMLGESAKKRAVARGMSTDVAEAMAASQIRRVLQAWDEMTPMERSVMRSLVPFYGFAAYATKFALRYPFDHPFRASTLGSLTRAELSDAMTGLPEYVREMIFLGDPRADGATRALNVSPFNPFGGVPSMFTVAGFLGQLNPVITGVLESVGVNVQQGGPNLYPELRYDPETGRLIADPSGNLASNILGNISPQLQGVSSLLGFNTEFNETLQRDPGAAGRMLLSQFGMPVLFRDVDVEGQLIRSEMARFEDQENARKEALKSGNLSLLGDFPGLAAYGEQVRALEAAGQLDQFRPDTDLTGVEASRQGLPSGSSRAYAAQVALLGG